MVKSQLDKTNNGERGIEKFNYKFSVNVLYA